MCLAVFLASDRPLPLVPWVEERPSFNVSELAPDELRVRGRFSKRHVYYLGAYTGCSCGFTPDDEAEEEAAARSRDDLVRYVSEALASDPDAAFELFTCWDDDYLEPASRRIELRPDQLRDADTWFDEFVFATVRAPDAGAA